MAICQNEDFWSWKKKHFSLHFNSKDLNCCFLEQPKYLCISIVKIYYVFNHLASWELDEKINLLADSATGFGRREVLLVSLPCNGTSISSVHLRNMDCLLSKTPILPHEMSQTDTQCEMVGQGVKHCHSPESKLQEHFFYDHGGSASVVWPCSSHARLPPSKPLGFKMMNTTILLSIYLTK